MNFKEYCTLQIWGGIEPRHSTSKCLAKTFFIHDRIRTCNLSVRSRTRYPLRHMDLLKVVSGFTSFHKQCCGSRRKCWNHPKNIRHNTYEFWLRESPVSPFFVQEFYSVFCSMTFWCLKFSKKFDKFQPKNLKTKKWLNHKIKALYV